MHKSPLILLLGGLLATSFFAIGLANLGQKFDPVAHRAQSTPVIQVADGDPTPPIIIRRTA